MTGIEPANDGTTTHCRNHLATLALVDILSIISIFYENKNVFCDFSLIFEFHLLKHHKYSDY